MKLTTIFLFQSFLINNTFSQCANTSPLGTGYCTTSTKLIPIFSFFDFFFCFFLFNVCEFQKTQTNKSITKHRYNFFAKSHYLSHFMQNISHTHTHTHTHTHCTTHKNVRFSQCVICVVLVVNSTPECDYDGGDCCESTCVSTTTYTCGSNGYRCKDPSQNTNCPYDLSDLGNGRCDSYMKL